ncbi:MAG: hypothetical protein R2798_04190 [Chitinophagales bacterium]|nr:hypothetical protein [Bacteroidota bacterium]
MKSFIMSFFYRCIVLEVLLVVLIFSTRTLAQQGTFAENGNIILFPVSYGISVPVGDLAERFGVFSEAGVSIYRKTAKNWLWGAEGNYKFGTQVKEPGLAQNLYTAQGTISAIDGTPAEMAFEMRGGSLYFNVGHFFGYRPFSAWFVLGGVGFLQHQIYVNNQGRAIPQLESPYSKGYDRLSNGLALQQSVGYMHLSSRNHLNFYLRLELEEAFTQNRRSFNYDTRTAETTGRFDMAICLKFAWVLPVYTGIRESDYYY